MTPSPREARCMKSRLMTVERCEECSGRRRSNGVTQYFVDHTFLDCYRQSLPYEFSDAQISRHCNKTKLTDSEGREREPALPTTF